MGISTATLRSFHEELSKIAAYEAKHVLRGTAAGFVGGAIAMHQGKKALDDYRTERAYAKARRG